MSAIPSLKTESLQTLVNSLGDKPREEFPVLLAELEYVRALVSLMASTSTASAPAQHEEYLPVEIVAERIGFGTDYVWRKARAGKFPFAIKKGRSWRFLARGLDEWMSGTGNKDNLTARQPKRKLAIV